MGGDHDAVEEQNDLRPFPHDRDRDDGRQGEEGALPEPDLFAELAEFAGHGAAVVRHPDDVPSQHDDSEQQYGCGKGLLSGALKGIRQGAGERGDDTGAKEAGGDTARDPSSAPQHAFRGCEDDADDQAGLHRFPEDDDQTDEHAVRSPAVQVRVIRNWRRP